MLAAPMHTPPFYRKDIDGLRAIAILSVVAYHVGIPGFSGGFVGVDVFFVISGFLITLLLVAEVRRSGRLSLRAFYARRVRRLFPALAVVVFATCVLAAFTLLPIDDQPQDLAGSAVATALYVSNIHFWLNSPGYFDPSSDVMPLLHTWSLSVEEQFYLVWPPIILGVLALARRRSWPFERTLLVFAILVLAASLAWSVHRTQQDPVAAFYLLPTRAFELATGAMLAIWLPGVAARNAVAGTLCSLAGLVAIVLAAVMLHEDMDLPGFLAAIPVAGAGLVILGGHLAERNPVQSVLSTRPMVMIGLLSYSWYLWHWPLLALARSYELDSRATVRDLAIAGLSLAVAWLSYRFVENPIRFGRPGPFRRDSATLVAGLVITLVIGVSAGLLELWARHAERDPQYAPLTAAKEDRPPLRATCHQHDPFEGLAPVAQCRAGSPGRTPSLLLWGDSHADHLSPLMQAFAASSPATPTLSRSFSACPPMQVDTFNDPREAAACREFNAAVLAEARSLQAEGLRAVLLSARWLRVFGAPRLYPTADGARLKSGGLAAPENTADLERTVGQLSFAGLRVLIMAPLPEFPYDVPGCIARRGAAGCNLPRSEVDAQRRDVVALLAAIAGRYPGVEVLDLIDAVCDESLCYADRDGTIVFLDDHHLTATASRALLTFARPVLLEAAGGRLRED